MIDKLIERINSNCNNVDINFVNKAYEFSVSAHKEQKRESGEPYIIHPFEVACILAELGLDTSTIVAGLLHDVIEDTEYTYEDVCKIFSVEVADLVEGVSKLEKIKYKTKEEQQADNVRKMLLAMAKDIRVILIKLADRLHNMRTLKYMSESKQREKAKETLDIYAPLAHRLGISKIKWELEDLALRYLNPTEYYDLVKLISDKRNEREEQINHIISQLKLNLNIVGIKADIEGRPKHFYSIYRKMIKSHKTIDQIFDLTAVRLLVGDIGNCYAALGIVHTMYKPIPGRFKDYIAMPKPNMYQSLHSTVIGPFGKPFEIQIRTVDMHKTAEYGIAAHWKYKENSQDVEKDKSLDSKLSWLREMLEWQVETSDAEEFMEGFKIDLFSDEVFVFTPKGDVISLPNDSTPIDFAYYIHTAVGHKCSGGKVNGKIVPLDYKLKTGEIVEVITSANSKGPSIDWINIVKSNQAKSKIKLWFKKANREEAIAKGKELVDKECKRQNYTFSQIINEDILEKTIRRYNLKNIEDLYQGVGVGEINPTNMITKLKDAYDKENSKLLKITDVNIIKEEKPRKQINNNYSGITVKDMSNIQVRFAKCCSPVYGDKITGYITRGKGVSIHRSDCKNIITLEENESHKIVEVSWGNGNKENYTADIEIKAEDRLGLLTDIIEVLSGLKANILYISAITNKHNIAVVSLKVNISGIDHLKDIQAKLKKIKDVKDVYRKKN
ncbi:bifunctional (p)ppGpp synthetase/guanosine-3',5'-bis(diphosphate) 3'-pyrophosphohydrolase [Clostridium sp.]|uniref:RelA/SpoT family protein n=1 Tax=Clostridium sp. TaxID=1506 RepID=UPI0032163316